MDEKISWFGPEFFHWEKGVEWYSAVGIIAFALVVVSVIFGNYIFAILIVVAVVALVLFSLRGPRIVNVEINNRGVVLDKYFYSYKNLTSFYLDEESLHPKILFKSSRFLMPYIHLPITEDVDAGQIRNFLLQYLEEEELHEPFFQKLLEMLGF